MEIQTTWIEENRFSARTGDDRQLKMDGDSKQDYSPTELLLSSLAGCMAIDVVMILKKMRVDLQGLTVHAEGRRRSQPPRYFEEIILRFRVKGDVARAKIERAVRLSLDTYCSVFHTLRQDLELRHEVEIEPADDNRMKT